MRKTIKINDKQITFNASAGTIIKYKSQFDADYNTDLAKVESLDKDDKDYLPLTLIIGYRLIWAMAETKATPEVFYNTFKNINIYSDEFEIEDFNTVLGIVTELFFNSAGATTIKDTEEETNTDTATSSTDMLTAENLITYALLCHLQISDLYKMPIKMILDIINQYTKIKFGDGKNNSDDDVREATQADFDRMNRMF